jgi:hypothetical protein
MFRVKKHIKRGVASIYEVFIKKWENNELIGF